MFIATIGAIAENFARPVLVDCTDNFCMDVSKVEAAITNARATLALRDAVDGGLDALVWSFAPPPRDRRPVPGEVPATTPESVALAKASWS